MPSKKKSFFFNLFYFIFSFPFDLQENLHCSPMSPGEKIKRWLVETEGSEKEFPYEEHSKNEQLVRMMTFLFGCYFSMSGGVLYVMFVPFIIQ